MQSLARSKGVARVSGAGARRSVQDGATQPRASSYSQVPLGRSWSAARGGEEDPKGESGF